MYGSMSFQAVRFLRMNNDPAPWLRILVKFSWFETTYLMLISFRSPCCGKLHHYYRHSPIQQCPIRLLDTLHVIFSMFSSPISRPSLIRASLPLALLLPCTASIHWASSSAFSDIHQITSQATEPNVHLIPWSVQSLATGASCPY
jgi:hypothetical protein